MFFPDRTKGYSEARRVLKKGGSFFFNVWDKIETNEFADVVTNAAGKMFPDDPPRFLARTPHGYFEHDLIGEDLTQAGFSEFAIVTKEETSRAPTARQVAVAYCQGTPLRNEIEARDRSSVQQVVDIATAALEARYGKGAVAAKNLRSYRHFHRINRQVSDLASLSHVWRTQQKDGSNGGNALADCG